MDHQVVRTGFQTFIPGLEEETSICPMTGNPTFPCDGGIDDPRVCLSDAPPCEELPWKAQRAAAVLRQEQRDAECQEVPNLAAPETPESDNLFD